MKKFITVILLCAASVPAVAQHRHSHGPYATGVPHHHHYHHYKDRSGNWVAPLIIGGVIGYAITRNSDPVVVQQPPVIVQQPVIIAPPAGANCGPWVETQQVDGSIVRQRLCTQ